MKKTLQELRRDKNLTQEQASKILAITKEYLSMLENGDRNPSDNLKEKMAKLYNKPVIAFAGSVTKEAKLCNQEGIDAYFPIIRNITTLQEAMAKENAKNNLMDTVEQVFRLWKIKQ